MGEKHAVLLGLGAALLLLLMNVCYYPAANITLQLKNAHFKYCVSSCSVPSGLSLPLVVTLAVCMMQTAE